MQMRGDLTKPLSMPVLNYNWPVTETERVRNLVAYRLNEC